MSAGSTRRGRSGGRSITSRQSRRVQGLQPEEHMDQDAVIQDTRKAGAAKRKTAQEEKESSTSREEPSPGWPSRARTKLPRMLTSRSIRVKRSRRL
ncbi:hypothetical protein PHMEG_00010814 [Phytophthora megakarya]|uniref:Uncharacterized protein n=1 Tax=Phytophthora megakarya TaxID=4795 RepID=A0A225WDA2_9STRA|nr:hypothetical protein PHMEG_00010814 [Phytophthora megakarya]